MSTGRFEIGRLALGDLVEMDGMLSRRQIVKFELECDARALIPDDDVPDSLALSVFEFDFGFGSAPGRNGEHYREHSEGETAELLHGVKPPERQIIAKIRNGLSRRRDGRMDDLSTKMWSILRRSLRILGGKS